jgi:DNA (cytosine-5)-methyltransferase 1
MAGDREDSWGKKKKFREGLAEQTLDDLSFVFIETVAKLKPRCVIMENVEGLIKGEAWSYVQKIYKQLRDIGYSVKHWLLKGQNMGVPQKRHRVFFVALRNDVAFDLEYLDMSFNYAAIPYKAFKSGDEQEAKGKISDAVKQLRPKESIGDAMFRIYGNHSALTHRVAKLDEVFPTQTAGHHDMWTESGNHPSIEDMITAQTFPQDYDFGGGYSQVNYICGMSVPPIMIKRIVTRLIESGLFDYKLRK